MRGIRRATSRTDAVTLTRYADPAEFLERVREYLERREDVNTLILGVATQAASGPQEAAPFLAVVEEGDRVLAVSVRTPPRPALPAADDPPDAALTPLVDHLAREVEGPTALVAQEPMAGRFADLWSRATGCRSRVAMRQQIYRIDRVEEVKGAPGRLRRAVEEELDLLGRWFHSFCAEAAEKVSPQEAMRRARRIMESTGVFLWVDPAVGDFPVSMASLARPTRHGISIGGVYTPDERRGRGYATACVVELSRRQLEKGYAFCALYADLANPTSNGIYRKIGYRPVAESGHYVFES